MNRNYLDEEWGEQHFKEMTNRGKDPETEMMMNPQNGIAVDKCIGWKEVLAWICGLDIAGEK